MVFPFAEMWSNKIVRFTTGGLLNLVNRLFWAFLFQAAGLPVWLNYLIVHIITLIFGFTFHSLVTFKKSISTSSFRNFFLSVLGLRIADYCLVLGANNLSLLRSSIHSLPAPGPFIAENLLPFSILTVSLIIFVIRYLVFKHITFKKM